MEKEGRLAAFRELTQACYAIWDWEMDASFQVVSSSCPYPSLFQKLMLGEGRRKIVQSHHEKSDAPLIMTVQTMLSWILVFDPNPDGAIYIKGPFFSLVNDPVRYDKILTDGRLAENTRTILRNSLRSLPAIPTQSARELAQMLHYCVTGETISAAEIVTYISQTRRKPRENAITSNQFEQSSRLWQMEQEILDKVRRGDLSISDAFAGVDGASVSYAFSNKTEDLRKYRSQLNHLLTLVSRAAVEGGLPKKTSFPLCTKYRQIVEACASAEEMQILSNEIINNYARQVHRVQQLSSCSARVKLCCEYINTHPEEKLMLSTLAEKAGYTESYLSRKFAQEMGCSITDYIQQSKIERSKFLLTNSEYTVDEISDLLGFGSRSYFSNVFKKIVGESPTQYRKNHKVI